MQWDIERWLTGRKYLFMISVALVLIAVIGFWLLLPLQAETSAGRSPQVQAQWRKLLPLRSALQAAGMEEGATQVFTPIDLPIAGATLIAWRPGGSAGEMQLAVDWQAVPALFSWLARCGMRATAFSLQPEKQALRLTLHLEAEDAP